MKIKELQQREEQREEFIKRTKNLLEFSEEMFESKEPKKRGRVRKERKTVPKPNFSVETKTVWRCVQRRRRRRRRRGGSTG